MRRATAARAGAWALGARALAVLVLASLLAAPVLGALPGTGDDLDGASPTISPLAVPSGYRAHRPLLEFFTGLSCPCCMAGPHGAIEGLYESSMADVTVPWTYVCFHELNGGGVDGLATDESQDRMRHYQPGVSGTPDAEIDGGWSELGGMYGRPTPDEANAQAALEGAEVRYMPHINPRQPIRGGIIPDFKYINMDVEQYYQDGEWAVVVKVEYLGMGRLLLNRELRGELYVFMVEDDVTAWSTVEEQEVLNHNVFRGYAIQGQSVQMAAGESAVFAGAWAIPDIVVEEGADYPEGTPVPVKPQDVTAVAAIFDLDDTDSSDGTQGNPNAVARCVESATPASTAHDRQNSADPVGDVRVTEGADGVSVEAYIGDPDGAASAAVFWSTEGATSANWSAATMSLAGQEVCDDSGACYAYSDATATATIDVGGADRVWLVVLYTDGKGAIGKTAALEHAVEGAATTGATGMASSSMAAIAVLALITLLLLVTMWRSRDAPTRKAVAAMLVLVLVLGGVFVASGAGSSSSGERVPDIAFTDLDGDDVELSDFRGRVVVLDMMATWCPDCRAAMADLERAYDDYGSRIELITIDIDPQETPEQLRAFKAEYRAGWRFAMDTDDQDFFTTFSVKFIPRIIVIDPRGRATFSAEGAVSADELGKEIDEAAAGGGGIVSIGAAATTGAGLLAWAVVLGTVTFFSPCSFPMLPGYMTYYMGLREARRLGKAVKGGLVAAAGLVTVYMLVAFLVGLFGSAISKYIFVLEPIVGVLLILMAAVILLNLSMGTMVAYLTTPVRWGLATARRAVGRVSARNVVATDAPASALEAAAEEGGYVGLFVYGMGYAAASAGCMAPVIIALIFLSAAQGSFMSSLLIFLVFSISAAACMVLITMAVGLGSGRLSGRLRISPSKVKLISGLMLAGIGIYILAYYFSGLA